ncbi:Panacea domain-containing protein [Staphylococcus auricularis]|nr:type II toxin-antitoxin system antitoxin SocA domain-containing protein [Staphylococcus auricularis]
MLSEKVNLMFYKHYLIFLENEKVGRRQAFHKLIQQESDFDNINSYGSQLDHLGLEYYTHIISTSYQSISSIEDKDSFFRDIDYYEDFEEFLEVAKTTQSLCAMDVARYILMLQPTTPLKLQKLLYIVYERYLLQFQTPLFNEAFLASNYGPIIIEDYDASQKENQLLSVEDDQSIFSMSDKATLPIKYKISRLKNSVYLRELVQSVIAEYKDYSAEDMLNIIQSNDTAWSRAHDYAQNETMSTELIKEAEPVKYAIN